MACFSSCSVFIRLCWICMTGLQNGWVLSLFSLQLIISSVIMNLCLLQWDTDVGYRLKALYQCMAHTCWETELTAFFNHSSASMFLLSFDASTDIFFSSPAFCVVVFIHHSGSERQMVVGWMFDQWPKWKEFMAFDWYEADERHYSVLLYPFIVW